MELDAILRNAGSRQRIFSGKEGRREIIIALGDEDPHAAVLPQRLAEVGSDVQIGVAVAPADAPVPIAADAGNRLIFAVGDEAEGAPGPAVDRGGVAGIDTVETGIIVGAFAGAVIILAGVARVQPPDSEAPIAQQLLVEAVRSYAQVSAIKERLAEPGEPRQLRADIGALLGRKLLALEQRQGIGPDGELPGFLDELLD